MREDGERNYLQIAGIQHFLFCHRQWGLIHLEQQWHENYFTIDGAAKHEIVDNGFAEEKMGSKRIMRSLHVISHELNIRGICDVVEFCEDERGEYFSKYDKKFVIHPVEYKRGKPKTIDSDILQLTAQCLCLEEMLGVSISEGAVFYFETRHREAIYFTEALKEKVKETVKEMNAYYRVGYTPKAKKRTKCRSCSLQDICMPELSNTGSVHAYIEEVVNE